MVKADTEVDHSQWGATRGMTPAQGIRGTCVYDVDDSVRLRVILVPDRAQARLPPKIPEYQLNLLHLHGTRNTGWGPPRRKSVSIALLDPRVNPVSEVQRAKHKIWKYKLLCLIFFQFE